ncbi:LLM class flavin-dependent oxidoreductase [Brachybacterium ginsengisoli]|uniref:LLM class flavin-dependent oxidoreductase n=1 Tax=Brachybacterium ginsengisoli TaxID=1331682 RepID=A0A291GWK2_9MICO|nr:LLM class flavin-dependent oxidoreductase [Brachybacterium ginsengisoli]ATG54590.1 LLM class flavin-dependent oxidoreductase [Brachybacterium ginsengisoli]
MTLDPQSLTFGLDTFGDVTVDGAGKAVPASQVLRDVVAQGELADQVGIDHFSIGEHHRPDFAVSAPDVVLAALASRTERITLGTAVIVLSSDDPLRVVERFSTLDALSEGRAELTVGRGSFTESFPLFGFALQDYEELFEEKLDLLATAITGEPITWTGATRPPLKDQSLFPPLERALPTWVAVGGSPNSVVRAARHGLPLMLAIIGGPAQRFAPYVQLFHEATQKLGNPRLPVGVHSPGHIAADDTTARDQLAPHWIHNRTEIGRERGWGPAGVAEFDGEVQHGALYVGSPETVARKIAATMRALDVNRFDLKYASGPMPHEQLMESIRLYGTEVIPRVRELLSEPGGPASAAGSAFDED